MDTLELTKNMTYTGSCHCKDVTFQISGPLRPIIICHCTDCLRTAGFSWAAAQFASAQLTFLSGEDKIDWYASSQQAKRGFCKRCHAQLFFRANDSGVTSVSPGMLDDLTGLEAAGHIYRSSMPHCCQQVENLPDIDAQFQANRP